MGVGKSQFVNTLKTVVEQHGKLAQVQHGGVLCELLLDACVVLCCAVCSLIAPMCRADYVRNDAQTAIKDTHVTKTLTFYPIEGK